MAIHWDGGAGIPVGYHPIDYYAAEARYHIAKDWGDGAYGHGLMYHYKIDRTGLIYQTRDLTDVVWAITAANRIGVSACVDATVGQGPTPAQLAAARSLVGWLWRRLPATAGQVFGHGELTAYGNATTCPGAELLGLASRLRGK